MALENIDPEILIEFVTETLDQLNEMEEKFVKLEKNPEDLEILNSIFRTFHSIKGSSAFFDLIAIKDIAHNTENLLDDLRKEKKKVTSNVISILLQGVDILQERFKSLQENNYQESFSSVETDYINSLEKLPQLESEEKGLTEYDNEINMLIVEIGEKFINKYPKVKKLINLFDQFKRDFLGQEAAEIEKQDDSKNVLYKYDSFDFTQHIYDFQRFLSKAMLYPPEDKDYQAFSSALDQFLKLCQEKNLEPLIIILKSLKENFDNISCSAVDLDELLLSIVEEDVNKLLEIMKSVEPVKDETEIQKLGEILVAEGKIDQEDIDEALNKQKKVGEILCEEGKISEDDLKQALGVQKDQIIKKPIEDQKKTLFKTMRIDESKIDSFMNFVGELIVSSEVFNYIQKKIDITNKLPQLAKEYKNANLAFVELSNNLQKSLMEIRKIPIKNLLQKMPRMVRDIAKNLDKDISLEIKGEETRVDKSILENIENPLIHIVRNSADHGIETKSERVSVGKPEQGTIKISAYSDNTFFYLDIIDDGNGVDPKNIKDSALKKGLLSQSKYDSITDQEALRLVFLAGVSTAKRVTDLSGRGVGMDVVISNLKKANGSIDIESEPGKGTTIQMKIPLSVTLIVVDGLVVQVGGENFIIPISKIKESLRPDSDDVITVTKKGEMIKIRENLFPLVRLHELFNITTKMERPSEAVVVLVEHENGRSCFLVDELVGQQQVVQKDLGGYLKGISTISGGAIMGDGRIGLILNIEGILDKVSV